MSTHNAEPINENKPETGIERFVALHNLPQDEVVKAIKYELLEGNVDPIQMYVALRRIGKIVESTVDSSKGDKEIKELFKEKVRLALDGGKSIDIFGANLSIRNTGTRYDFSESKDSVLNELYKIRDLVKEQIDEREKTIKAMFPNGGTSKLGIQAKKVIQEGLPMFSYSDDEFEETIYPPVVYGGESIFCTFKKEK
jgi:hypothetical protein